jgi:Tol biopolymer transport system component/uncharacterized cupredoxin-like copper-binding protein
MLLVNTVAARNGLMKDVSTPIWGMICCLLMVGCAGASPVVTSPALTPSGPPPTNSATPTASPTVAPSPTPESLTWSGEIAFASERDGNSEIYLVDSGGALTRLTDDPAEDVGPAWSPDGTRIAFASNRGGSFDIYVMDADGTGVTRLTEAAGDNGFPAWSPDGTRIAFASNRGASFDIYTMGADGGQVEQLTSASDDDFNPHWAPDGSQLVFDRDLDGNNLEIYTLAVDGTAETPLTDEAGTDFYPSWSPDGTEILFASDRAGGFDIYLMRPDGSDVRLVIGSAADDVAPAFSEDASMIAFVSTQDGNEEVYLASADGTRITRLTDHPADDGNPAMRPTVAPAPVGNTTFTSGRHAYSIEIPAGWSISEVPGVWPADRLMQPDEPGVDTFRSPAAISGGVYKGTLFISRAEVAAGTSDATWAEPNRTVVAQLCALRDTGQATVEGLPVELTTWGCPQARALNLHFVRGSFGYLIVWIGPYAQAAADEQQLREIAATFRSTPPAAVVELTMTQSGGVPPLGYFPGVLSVDAGTVTFDLRNQTEGRHDFIIGLAGAEPAGEELARSSIIQPTESLLFTVENLAPGTYKFWCDVDQHYNAGMVGRLTVKP